MKQLFISHFPKKDTEAQGGDGLLEVTQQEWLSWVGFVSHPSESCSQDSPEGRTQGANPGFKDLD